MKCNGFISVLLQCASTLCTSEGFGNKNHDQTIFNVFLMFIKLHDQVKNKFIVAVLFSEIFCI